MSSSLPLGAHLATVRKRLGRKQVELSQLLRYPYNVLSKWENGQAKPSRAEWAELVTLLGPELEQGLSPETLREGLVPEKADHEPQLRLSRIEEGIVKRLRHLRESAGYTARHVAEQIGIHASQYTRIEQGSSNPTYGQLRELAYLYDTTYDYLLDGKPSADKQLAELKKENARLKKALAALVAQPAA
jgi:transcriptional regulator with XRE-family HTH domain